MARLSFVTARAAAVRSSRRLRRRAAFRARVWERRVIRLFRPLVPDAADREFVGVWVVRGAGLLLASATVGLAVRLFGVTSGLF